MMDGSCAQATNTFACRLARVHNIARQDSAERALNKLAPTFAVQVEGAEREHQDLWGARGRRVATGRFRLSSRLPKMPPAVPLFRGTPDILMLSYECSYPAPSQ